MRLLIMRHLKRALAYQSVRAAVLTVCLGFAFGLAGKESAAMLCLSVGALLSFFRIFVLQARLDEADLLLARLESALRLQSASEERR